MLAVESRLKAAVLLSGGMNSFFWTSARNQRRKLLGRVKIPILMVNGRYDLFFRSKRPRVRCSVYWARQPQISGMSSFPAATRSTPPKFATKRFAKYFHGLTGTSESHKTAFGVSCELCAVQLAVLSFGTAFLTPALATSLPPGGTVTSACPGLPGAWASNFLETGFEATSTCRHRTFRKGDFAGIKPS